MPEHLYPWITKMSCQVTAYFTVDLRINYQFNFALVHEYNLSKFIVIEDSIHIC